MIILGTNSIKETGFNVANSVRLDNNAYFSRTFSETGAGSGGGTFKWTLSLWFKRSLIDGNEHVLMSRYVNANKYVTIKINGNNKIEYRVYNSGNQCRLTTTAGLRDPTAWTHFVIGQDTSVGTAGDRTKFFINGSRVTAFDTQTNFSQNVGGDFNTASEHQLGAFNGGDEFQGYFAQVCFVDNVQYDADQFGEFDSDSPTIWKPKDVSGLSTGATSFFLDFADSGDLGDDESGNTNDFTENNLAATDQSTDTCTLNYATFNPLNPAASNSSFAEGNLTFKTDGSASAQRATFANFGISTGKWYAEFKLTAESTTSGSFPYIGVAAIDKFAHTYIGANLDSVAFNSNQAVYSNESEIDSGETNVGDGDIVGVAADITNKKIYFHVNGTYINSQNPASGTNGYTLPNTTNGVYCFAASLYGASGTWEANFGSPSFAISSGNADANGYGNMEYAVPSGFLILNSANLGSDGG